MNAKLQINKLQIRNDTANNWRIKNPILSKGEMGVEIDNYKIKIGNGSTYWNNLPYVGSDLDTSNLAKLDSYNEFKGYAAFGNGIKISGGLFYDNNPGSKPPRPLSITSEDGIQMKGNVSTENIKITQPATHPLHGVTKAYVDNAVQQTNLPIGYITLQPYLLDGFVEFGQTIPKTHPAYSPLLEFAKKEKILGVNNGDPSQRDFFRDGPNGLSLPDIAPSFIDWPTVFKKDMIPQIKY